jgi:hypothetical protein
MNVKKCHHAERAEKITADTAEYQIERSASLARILLGGLRDNCILKFGLLTRLAYHALVILFSRRGRECVAGDRRTSD